MSRSSEIERVFSLFPVCPCHPALSSAVELKQRRPKHVNCLGASFVVLCSADIRGIRPFGAVCNFERHFVTFAEFIEFHTSKFV